MHWLNINRKVKGGIILFSKVVRFGLIDFLCRKICFKYREKWWIGNLVLNLIIQENELKVVFIQKPHEGIRAVAEGL